MLVDNYKQHDVDAVFQEAINNTEILLIENNDVSSVIVCGDINVYLSRDNAQSKCMWDFNERNQLVFGQLYINAKYTYTYSDVINNKELRSAIDYFIVSDNLFECIQTLVNIGEHAPRNVTNDMCDSIFNPSKHCVLKMEITRPVNHIEIDSSWQERNYITWYKVSDEHIR